MTSVFFYIMTCLLYMSTSVNSDFLRPKEFHLQLKSKYSTKESPPDHDQVIAMARFTVHKADWASVATTSTIPAVKGFPFATMSSMSDGPVTNSSGVPYFYLTPKDYTATDLERNSKCTILVSLAETPYCQSENFDPQDPRCTRIMLVGKMAKVKPNTTEHKFAQYALFSRHPTFPSYPADHKFFIAKLKIAYIAMLDWFGGPKVIPVQKYLSFNYTDFENSNPEIKNSFEIYNMYI